MEHNSINMNNVLHNKSNIKTVYVIPKFNSEDNILLRDNAPSPSTKNIIVETALPCKRRTKNMSFLVSPRIGMEHSELNTVKTGSISMMASTFNTDDETIDLEEGDIFISGDTDKHEIDEEFLEITVSGDDSYDTELKQELSSSIWPLLLPKNTRNSMQRPAKAHQSNISEIKNRTNGLGCNDRLEKAVRDVYEKNFSLLRAAHINGVKLHSLECYLNGQTQKNKGLMGADPALSETEEIALVEWIKSRYKSGFPVKKIDLINKVANMVIGRQTRFKEGIPGEKWFLNFIMRHPTVSSIGPCSRADSRQIPSKKSINTWFQTCQEYLIACGNSDLLNNPSNIGTAEEISLKLNPTSSESDEESSEYTSRNDEFGNIIVLIGACADGEFMPPMPVFSCRKPPPNLVDSVSYGWGVGLSKEGAVDKDILFNYFKNILIPWLVEKNKIPFILFIDKLRFYLSVETADFCSQKGLIIYNFYPNSNYVLEPLYKYVIDGIKTAFNALKHYSSEKMALLHFCPNLSKVIQGIATPIVIKESFKLCGIYPFDHNAADYKKCLLGIAQMEAKNFTMLEYTQALEVIEALIGQVKLTSFCNAVTDSTLSLENEDKSLFKLWSKIATNADTDRKQNAESQEYKHEKILRAGIRKLPRPDMFLRVVEDDESLNFANFSGNILPPMESTSLDDYSSKLLEGIELLEVEEEYSQDKELNNIKEGTLKCISAKLWKEYYQVGQSSIKNKKRLKLIQSNVQDHKKIKISKEGQCLNRSDVCFQCLKRDDTLITCKVCRKSIHFECMVDNEKELLDHLRKGVLDFEYICPACS